MQYNKKNILIWGAGIQGEKVCQLFDQNNMYEVVAFGDNNEMLWGEKKCGRIIIGPMELKRFQNLDVIFVASVAAKEIERQLKEIVDVPIFDNVNDLIFQRMAIDISGCCNAKCKWCVTGRKNRQAQECCVQFMTFAEFAKLYNHLFEKGIIGKNTDIMLYNWGEPLLNKEYDYIIEFLSDQGQTFSVSTNGSKVNLLKKENAYKNCKTFIFSMSGFSQEAYDRIHGFSFEKIKKNIEMICTNLRNLGFEGTGILSYHVYKFNVHEIGSAHEFAESMGLRFYPYYPYFAGNSMMEEYLEGRMEKKIKEEAEQDLFLSHVKELLKQRPLNYHCFLENIICIDCESQLTLCCASDNGCKDFIWGNIYDVNSFEELKLKRQEILKCQTCQKCRLLGIDYWMEHNPVYVKESALIS